MCFTNVQVVTYYRNFSYATSIFPPLPPLVAASLFAFPAKQGLNGASGA